jgi:hypothetical protein
MRIPAFAVLRSLVVALLLGSGVVTSSVMSNATAAPARSGVLAPATGVHGADISWPQCPKGMGIKKRRTEGQPMPTKDASFVVVGVTNGPGFHPNPCLAEQVAWVRSHHRYLAAYAMTTYPRKKDIRAYGQDGPYDATKRRGALRNTAYAEATYNLSTMAAANLVVPMIWVDVEPYPTFPWPKNHRNNRAVVKAVLRAYTEAGYQVGLYTYLNGWKIVVGSWQLPDLPTWSTIGGGRAKQARRACGHGPSGGSDWLMQFWRNSRDKDLICPAGAEQGSVMFASPG